MSNENASEVVDTLAGADTNSEQFLTFMLAGEEYGVDILRVQEIKGWDTVTEIPNTPAAIRGVINLRGSIVPIIDLRRRFELEPVEYGKTTVVIVLKVEGHDKERTIGVVVDAVSEVYVVPNEEIKEAPDFGAVVDITFVKGLATVNDKMLILLDVDKLMTVDVVKGAQALEA